MENDVAATLWRLGRREEAVEHQRELLRLNPRDNQGLRYRQVHWLLALESYAELEQLFAAYAEDRVPGFVYAKALAAFARRSDDVLLRTVGMGPRPAAPGVVLPAFQPGPHDAARSSTAGAVRSSTPDEDVADLLVEQILAAGAYIGVLARANEA